MTGDRGEIWALRARLGRFRKGIAVKRQEIGIPAATALAGRWAAAFVVKQASRLRDRVYDARRGYDTVADIPDWERPANATFDDAVYYARTSRGLFKAMMADLVEPGGFTFIDLGCGKGAVMLLALEHGFKSVVGVELNERLASIAEGNLRTWKAGRVEPEGVVTRVESADVVRFTFPAEPSVVYMYNPFGAHTMKAVLANLEQSLTNSPRDVVICYLSPVHSDVLDRSPMLARQASSSPRWAVYRSVCSGAESG